MDVAGIINLAAEIDKQSLDTLVTNLSNTVSKIPPISLQTMTKGTVNTGVSDAIFNSVKAEADLIDKVTVRQQTFRNAAGAQIEVVTGMTVDWNNKLSKTVDIVNAIPAGFKKVKGAHSEATVDIAAGIKANQKAYAAQNKEIDGMAAKATAWEQQSHHMAGVEVDDARKTIALLQAKKIEWDNAYKKGAPAKDLDNITNSMKALNKVVLEQEAAVKQGAGANRSWGSSIANAFKQTIAYTFSLGLVRKAQTFLNNGIQYAIDLNTEMVKIQVLQVDGAQTGDEINKLALSYNSLAKEMGTTTLEIAKGSTEWLLIRSL